MENSTKYGLLVRLPSAQTFGWPASAPLMAVTSLALPLLSAWGIEKAAIGSRPERVWVYDTLHSVNMLSGLVVACYLVHVDAGGGGTAGGILLLLAAITLFMKLASWAHVHHDLVTPWPMIW